MTSLGLALGLACLKARERVSTAQKPTQKHAVWSDQSCLHFRLKGLSLTVQLAAQEPLGCPQCGATAGAPQPHACTAHRPAAQAAPAPASRPAVGAAAHVTLRPAGFGAAAKALPAAGDAPKAARTSGAAGRSWGPAAGGGAPGAPAGALAAGGAAEELRHALLELQETRELNEARPMLTGCWAQGACVALWSTSHCSLLLHSALCLMLVLARSLQILEAKTRKLEQLLRLKDEKIDALEARLRAGHPA